MCREIILYPYRELKNSELICSLFDAICSGDTVTALDILSNIPSVEIDFFVATSFYFLCIRGERVNYVIIDRAMRELSLYSLAQASTEMKKQVACTVAIVDDKKHTKSKSNHEYRFCLRLLEYLIEFNMHHVILDCMRSKRIRKAIFHKKLLSKEDFSDYVLILALRRKCEQGSDCLVKMLKERPKIKDNLLRLVELYGRLDPENDLKQDLKVFLSHYPEFCDLHAQLKY